MPPAAPHLQVKTSNIKGHFRVATPVSLPSAADEARTFKRVTAHSNFWTVRPKHAVYDSLVFTVFPKSGYVNFSGVKNFGDCDAIKSEFERLFGVRATSAVSVDNSTSSGRLPFARIPLARLYWSVTGQQQQPRQQPAGGGGGGGSCYPCTISLRPHYFPSALLRPIKACCKDIGTSILFPNGKFIVVGAKSPGQVARTARNLHRLVDATVAAAAATAPAATG